MLPSVFGLGSQCYAVSLSNHFLIIVDAQSVRCVAAGRRAAHVRIRARVDLHSGAGESSLFRCLVLMAAWFWRLPPTFAAATNVASRNGIRALCCCVDLVVAVNHFLDCVNPQSLTRSLAFLCQLFVFHAFIFLYVSRHAKRFW
jgi:hypothetical protein